MNYKYFTSTWSSFSVLQLHFAEDFMQYLHGFLSCLRKRTSSQPHCHTQYSWPTHPYQIACNGRLLIRVTWLVADSLGLQSKILGFLISDLQYRLLVSRGLCVGPELCSLGPTLHRRCWICLSFFTEDIISLFQGCRRLSSGGREAFLGVPGDHNQTSYHGR